MQIRQLKKLRCLNATDPTIFPASAEQLGGNSHHFNDNNYNKSPTLLILKLNHYWFSIKLFRNHVYKAKTSERASNSGSAAQRSKEFIEASKLNAQQVKEKWEGSDI